jgi:hypothetical protein
MVGGLVSTGVMNALHLFCLVSADELMVMAGRNRWRTYDAHLLSQMKGTALPDVDGSNFKGWHDKTNRKNTLCFSWSFGCNILSGSGWLWDKILVCCLFRLILLLLVDLIKLLYFRDAIMEMGLPRVEKEMWTKWLLLYCLNYGNQIAKLYRHESRCYIFVALKFLGNHSNVQTEANPKCCLNSIARF